ncbi:hypothetical protein NM208_g13282 [Fusarium decemcellulare]|uniref:Uncharacterized protein n=1 Tax=Fusarium decemcellulare TaxID=57161 RepID=A0ACC1RMY6_9HYPO|nr:hypothetical protein NM208_g13282 [Fusarium decemcellulare]
MRETSPALTFDDLHIKVRYKPTNRRYVTVNLGEKLLYFEHYVNKINDDKRPDGNPYAHTGTCTECNLPYLRSPFAMYYTALGGAGRQFNGVLQYGFYQPTTGPSHQLHYRLLLFNAQTQWNDAVVSVAARDDITIWDNEIRENRNAPESLSSFFLADTYETVSCSKHMGFETAESWRKEMCGGRFFAGSIRHHWCTQATTTFNFDRVRGQFYHFDTLATDQRVLLHHAVLAFRVALGWGVLTYENWAIKMKDLNHSFSFNGSNDYLSMGGFKILALDLVARLIVLVIRLKWRVGEEPPQRSDARYPNPWCLGPLVAGPLPKRLVQRLL